ncbi:MAG: hypothetical protein AB7H77_02915 [Bdellovibrionales bacterium]
MAASGVKISDLNKKQTARMLSGGEVAVPSVKVSGFYLSEDTKASLITQLAAAARELQVSGSKAQALVSRVDDGYKVAISFSGRTQSPHAEATGATVPLAFQSALREATDNKAAGVRRRLKRSEAKNTNGQANGHANGVNGSKSPANGSSQENGSSHSKSSKVLGGYAPETRDEAQGMKIVGRINRRAAQPGAAQL